MLTRLVRLLGHLRRGDFHRLLLNRNVQGVLGLFSSGRVIRVRIPPYPHPVALRLNTSDTLVALQTFREEQYAPVVRPGFQPKFIVDCGANVGTTAAYFLWRFPTAQVIALEPDPGNFRQLCENVAPFGDRCIPLKEAIWGKESSLQIVRSDREWGFSAAETSDPNLREVGATTILRLLERFGHSRIDLLKIDIEGGEASLFGEGVSLWLPKVANIAIELHGPACEQIFHQALETMRFRGAAEGELIFCFDMEKKQAEKASGRAI